VERCAHQEEDSGCPVEPEGNLDPPASGTHQKQDQGHVEQSQDRTIVSPSISRIHPIPYLTAILTVAGPLLPCLLQLASAVTSRSLSAFTFTSLVNVAPSGRFLSV
jgi:hypothetical protein